MQKKRRRNRKFLRRVFKEYYHAVALYNSILTAKDKNPIRNEGISKAVKKWVDIMPRNRFPREIKER